MFSLICVWTNGWANNRDAGDLSRHRAHYDITVMKIDVWPWNFEIWSWSAIELPIRSYNVIYHIQLFKYHSEITMCFLFNNLPFGVNMRQGSDCTKTSLPQCPFTIRQCQLPDQFMALRHKVSSINALQRRNRYKPVVWIAQALLVVFIPRMN